MNKSLNTPATAFGLFALTALLAVGCASPKAHTADFAGTEGWPPAVSSISPGAGHAGVVVALKGDYLDDAKQVIIGGEPASFTMAGSVIMATVPSDLGPGPAKVVVIVPRGKTAPMTFNVVL